MRDRTVADRKESLILSMESDHNLSPLSEKAIKILMKLSVKDLSILSIEMRSARRLTNIRLLKD